MSDRRKSALAKCLAYGTYLRRLIVRITSKPATFHDFFFVLCRATFTLMISFGLDFFVHYCQRRSRRVCF